MPLTSASKSKKSPTKTKSTTNYLTDYKVVALTVPFYKQTKSGRFTLDTVLNRREGDADMARRGDVFTGSLKFTCSQVYVNLGFNAFLPLTNTDTGEIMLQTKKKLPKLYKTNNQKINKQN